MMPWLRVWKWLNHLLSLIGALAVIVVVTFWIGSSRGNSTPVLPEHPDAVWRGAQDGGYFIEITQSMPPDYFVQVRYESGSLLREGWTRFSTPDDKPLTMNRVSGADSDYLFIDSFVPITASKGGRVQ
ncbi:hypothetical protein LOY38_28910 [Pseudomonas sp. B21-015]|uniref:hypothetical protein n=1 Tax=Pseudomonas sp. B21-015 TaxID=2895473 RepID=UPI002160D8A1|nr:hypothetical protein [Pseudomonas sp. B21-015]UVM50296.1 hypothetical protein LOY38_28910 [Pseudomonas sp. B21-015]